SIFLRLSREILPSRIHSDLTSQAATPRYKQCMTSTGTNAIGSKYSNRSSSDHRTCVFLTCSLRAFAVLHCRHLIASRRCSVGSLGFQLFWFSMPPKARVGTMVHRWQHERTDACPEIFRAAGKSQVQAMSAPRTTRPASYSLVDRLIP